jgi:hypothetical protein
MMISNGGKRGSFDLLQQEVARGSESSLWFLVSCAVPATESDSIPRQISSCAQRGVNFGQIPTRQLDGNRLTSFSSRRFWSTGSYIHNSVNRCSYRYLK